MTPGFFTSIPTIDTTSPLLVFIIEGSPIALYIFLNINTSAVVSSTPSYNAFNILFETLPSFVLGMVSFFPSLIDIVSAKTFLSSKVNVFLISPFALFFASLTIASYNSPKFLILFLDIKFKIALLFSPFLLFNSSTSTFSAAC